MFLNFISCFVRTLLNPASRVAIKDTAPELLLACVLYVKRQWDGGAACVGGATATRLRACVVVLTSAGPRRPAETAVHFSPAYDNPVDLRTQLAGG